MTQHPKVHIIGAGLAGSEAAFTLARQGFAVTLFEMRPEKLTPAHRTGGCAELVCSNSLKSRAPTSAPGMLKSEMREVGSLILDAAEVAQVPAGDALGVDREVFSKHVTERLLADPRIEIRSGERSAPDPEAITILATGPLTSEPLAQWLAKATGEKDLYFYDAIAPIVDAATIDPERSFAANRYDKGEEVAYINCPMDEAEYHAFMDALASAEKVAPKAFEEEKFFQGCQPIEAIAATGRDTLRFGPMKPVGLTDPRTGRRPYAVVQLRPENRARTAYNLVGFQTKLKYGEQARVFRMIPALAKAEFVRMGSIHRNTYVCGPRVLRADLSLRGHPRVYLAGQITGVEGYLESAAIGMVAGLMIGQRLRGERISPPPPNTSLGALLRHVTASDADRYQPMNACFAIFDPAMFNGVVGLKKDPMRTAMAEQALSHFRAWREGASV